MTLVKLTLNHNVYRRPAPTNEQPALGYLPINTSIDVEEIVIGKAIEDNDIWYKTSDGNFYWSGGITSMVEFGSLPGAFTSLTPNQQASVCRQAMNYYGPVLLNRYKEVTALSVTEKQVAGSYLPIFCLAIFVQKKEKDIQSEKQLPSKLPFKGFTIPTDLREAQPAVLCAPGEMITKPSPYNMRGTLGFVATDNLRNYLVTNYHVLCDDRLRVRQLRLRREDNFSARIAEHLGRRVGELADGWLDAYIDCVKVQLQVGGITNLVADGTQLTGILNREQITNFQPNTIRVRIVGAVSRSRQKIQEGTIDSLNAIVPIPAINHTFFNVIKVKVPSIEGDSGAPVFTIPDNRLIGILAASDLVTFSYVIPVDTLLRRLELTGLANL